MELTDLHACRTPARLAFADHMDGLVTGDRAKQPKSNENLSAHSAFDNPVVLFQNIVEILHGLCWQFSSRASSALSRTMAGG
jgi:hypothetical protein